MRVLITGGTGSLGHALVRRWKDSAERIVVYSRDELKQAQMAEKFSDPNLRFFIGDVRDRDRLEEALVGIDTVIHAAALKRVDAVAYNPAEVIKTNVLGTQNICQAAVRAGVRSVVVVSSDKAVEPANIYGSSKNVAEHLAVAANVYAVPRGTGVSVVRYGNVAWSRGSVLWRWDALLRQAAGRYAEGHLPVIPITDHRMTRFWLTLDQAADVIDYALDTQEAGEIYIPRLKAASMTDIALAMFNNMVKFNETGLRPGGEKLHEVLIGSEEASRTATYDHSFRIEPHLPTWRGHEVYGEDPDYHGKIQRYSSDMAPRMSQEEIMALLRSKPV